MPATSVTTTMDNLNAVTDRNLVTPIVKDAWLVDAPTYRLHYDRRVKLSGGSVISQPVRYARNDFQFYSAFEQFRTTMIQTKTEARYDWKGAAVPLTIDDFSIKRNGSNSIIKLAGQALKEGKEDFVNAASYNLFDSHGGELSIALPANLGGNIYMDNGDEVRFEGIRQAIRANASAHTYGNIGTGANTWWRSYVSNGTNASDDQGTGGTARALTLDLVRTALSNINKGASKAEFCVMDDDAFDVFESLIFPQKEFSGETADLGFTHIEYRGCVFYPDPYLQESKEPSGQSTLLFFNTDMFYLVVHEEDDMEWSGWMRPTDQKAFTGQITMYGNYICVNRLRLGRINNLTP